MFNIKKPLEYLLFVDYNTQYKDNQQFSFNKLFLTNEVMMNYGKMY